MNEKTNGRPFAPLIFWVSASITLASVLWPLFFPENMRTVVNRIFGRVTRFWGWFYLLSARTIYAMPTIPLPHACYRGLPFQFSSAFYHVICNGVYGTWGKGMDILAVFATLGDPAAIIGLVGGLGPPRGRLYRPTLAGPQYARFHPDGFGRDAGRYRRRVDLLRGDTQSPAGGLHRKGLPIPIRRVPAGGFGSQGLLLAEYPRSDK